MLLQWPFLLVITRGKKNYWFACRAIRRAGKENGAQAVSQQRLREVPEEEGENRRLALLRCQRSEIMQLYSWLNNWGSFSQAPSSHHFSLRWTQEYI